MSATIVQQAIMVADFDSMRQAELWRSTSNLDDALEAFKACLRIVDALGAQVLVPTPQVLDGAFFLLLGPEGVRTVLARDPGQRLPLTMTCTDASLAEWLDRRQGSDDFVWSSDAPLGASGLDADQIRQRRQAWLDAAEAGEFMVQPPGPIGATSWGPWEWEQVFTEALHPLPEFPAQCQRLAGIKQRSVVVHELERSSESAADRALLLDWWSWGYAEVLARQHCARWLDFSPAPRVTAATSSAERGNTLRIRGDLLESLGEMSSYGYATVLELAAPARSEWGRGKLERATRTLSMVVKEHTTPGDGWLLACVKTGSWTALLLALVVLSILSDVFPGASWLLIVPVLSILLTEIPWEQLQTLYARRPTALDPVLHLED